MEYSSYEYKSCRFEVAAFEVEGGRSEYHLMGHVTDASLDLAAQGAALTEAYADMLERLKATVVFERHFFADLANVYRHDGKGECTKLCPNPPRSPWRCGVTPESEVEQPPLDGTRIALWAYLQKGVTVTSSLLNFKVRHGRYTQVWVTPYIFEEGGAYASTKFMLECLTERLAFDGLALADCLRTWIFVRDPDRDYKEMVKARNRFFGAHGLTRETHYIASTGIGGKGRVVKTPVMIEGFAIDGLEPGQVRFLHAASHMCRTSDYGVRFERGTAVDFDGRRLIIISGTASIGPKGEVLFPCDASRQTERMLENIGALLAEAGAGFEDVGYMIVYLRTFADYPAVKRIFDERFPQTPRILVQAPVCRPEWLVEMECMAVKRI